MESGPVSLDVRERVAYLTLNRPDAMNAIDEAMLAMLPGALRSAASHPEVKALVVTGAGDAFCVGLDIDLLDRAFADAEYFADVVNRFKKILLDLERLPLPVIAAVNGLARAGGFELLLACDMAVAAEEARIGDTHMAFGVVPGGGASQRLPRTVGRQRAREIIFTGRWLDGRECAEIGLAVRAAPLAALGDAVEEIVAKIRPLSRAALAATKAAMIEGEDLPLDRALDVELEHFVRYLREIPSASEGFRAFVQKRAPSWD